jgi:outer membrane protein assembly factor BamE (lipoprotein component of BamABCDE complex)
MRTFPWILFVAAALMGCASSSVESRRTERSAAYQALSPEAKALVDQGKIKVGMSMDAVYIAWGKPSRIMTGETEKGETSTWYYTGTTWEEYRYWNYRRFHHGRQIYTEPYVDTDYVARDYDRAEIVFENGVVKSWKTIQ